MTNWKKLYTLRANLYKEIKALQENADNNAMSFNQYTSNYDKIIELRKKYNIINAMLKEDKRAKQRDEYVGRG